MSDLVHIRVRDDAVGFMAPYAGHVSPVAVPRREAEELCHASANGSQWELVPADLAAIREQVDSYPLNEDPWRP